MKEEQINDYKKLLMPLYEKMIAKSKLATDIDTAKFCMQWGINFPEEKNNGTVIIGRSPNGWMAHDDDVNELFNTDNEEGAFRRSDQMAWINEESMNDGQYRLSSSPFFRTLKAVANSLYADGVESIAWDDLYKIAPWEGGNPSDDLCEAIFDDCVEILKADIEFLSPKNVVMLTGANWANDFVKSICGGELPEPTRVIEWDSDYGYKAYLYSFNSINYIVSEHPQRKKEQAHVEAILELMK
jgi:hypothetical protein